jgi:hypothetical protein
MVKQYYLIIQGEEVSLPFDLTKVAVEADPDRARADPFFIAVDKGERDGKFYLSGHIQALNCRANLPNPGPYDDIEKAKAERDRIAVEVRAGNYQLIFRGMQKGIELKIP